MTVYTFKRGCPSNHFLEVVYTTCMGYLVINVVKPNLLSLINILKLILFMGGEELYLKLAGVPI